MLTGVSLFAGVGGFDLAMQRNGIHVTAAVEIDAKARDVLARRFPETALFNDVTEVTGDDLRSAGFVPDRGVITGGFPCQDLSVAGRRAGLAGKRSGLFWEIVRLVDDLAPRWLVLENVPGLLSSHGGRDMGTVVGALGDLGYGWAYRVLDAQHFGVPQRRRRVFIVAGRRAGAPDYAGPVSVLLEPEGVRGNPAPSGAAGQGAAGAAGAGTAGGRVVNALTRNGLGGGGPDDNLAQAGHLISQPPSTPAATAEDSEPSRENTLSSADPVAYQQHGTNVGPMGTLRKGDGGVTSGVPFVTVEVERERESQRLADSHGMQDVSSTVTTGTGQRMDPDTESLVVTSWER